MTTKDKMIATQLIDLAINSCDFRLESMGTNYGGEARLKAKLAKKLNLKQSSYIERKK